MKIYNQNCTKFGKSKKGTYKTNNICHRCTRCIFFTDPKRAERNKEIFDKLMQLN